MLVGYGGARSSSWHCQQMLEEDLRGLLTSIFCFAGRAHEQGFVFRGWCGVVWCGVVWCGVAWRGVAWRGVLWCGVAWRGVLCCAVLCCAVLCCAVLCCAVLCCAVCVCVCVSHSCVCVCVYVVCAETDQQIPSAFLPAVGSMGYPTPSPVRCEGLRPHAWCAWCIHVSGTQYAPETQIGCLTQTPSPAGCEGLRPHAWHA